MPETETELVELFVSAGCFVWVLVFAFDQTSTSFYWEIIVKIKIH